MTEAMANLMN